MLILPRYWIHAQIKFLFSPQVNRIDWNLHICLNSCLLSANFANKIRTSYINYFDSLPYLHRMKLISSDTVFPLGISFKYNARSLLLTLSGVAWSNTFKLPCRAIINQRVSLGKLKAHMYTVNTHKMTIHLWGHWCTVMLSRLHEAGKSRRWTRSRLFVFLVSSRSFIFGELDLLWLSSLTSIERNSRDTEEYLAINPKHKHTYTQSLFEITTLGPGSGTHICAVKFKMCVCFFTALCTESVCRAASLCPHSVSWL